MKAQVQVNDITIFGTRAVRQNLLAFTQEIEGVRQQSDIEAIHHMRVASRRLRSLFTIFIYYFPLKKTEEWIKEFRKLTRSLGNARDLDVQIEYQQTILDNLSDRHYRPGISRLLLRKTQFRRNRQKNVQRSLEHFLSTPTLSEINLSLLPPFVDAPNADVSSLLITNLANQAIASRMNDFFGKEEFILQPDNSAGLHALRIATKWLRYTMEIFVPVFPEKLNPSIQVTRKIQEILGNIHDRDVWMVELPLFIEKEKMRSLEYFGNLRSFTRLLPGFEYYQSKCFEERSEFYTKLVQDWEHQKSTLSDLQKFVRGMV